MVELDFSRTEAYGTTKDTAFSRRVRAGHRICTNRLPHVEGA